MKTKFIVLFSAILFLASSAFSQGFTFGLKGGANMGKITGKSFKEEFKVGYQVGAFATIPLSKRIAFQPEVLFNQTNADTSSQFSDIYRFNNITGIQLKQILVPLMVNVNLNKYLALQVGPEFGLLLDRNQNLLENGRDAFKTANYAAAAGLQLSISNFRAYGRFTGGLADLDDAGHNDRWKLQNIQLGIGFAL